MKRQDLPCTYLSHMSWKRKYYYSYYQEEPSGLPGPQAIMSGNFVGSGGACASKQADCHRQQGHADCFATFISTQLFTAIFSSFLCNAGPAEHVGKVTRRVVAVDATLQAMCRLHREAVLVC